MVKLVFLCRRRPDITHERYAELLLRAHVSLALRHHATTRYVTSVVDERLGGDGPDYDGFGELAFASAEDVRGRIYLSPAARRRSKPTSRVSSPASTPTWWRSTSSAGKPTRDSVSGRNRKRVSAVRWMVRNAVPQPAKPARQN